jgi:hypothetical protein
MEKIIIYPNTPESKLFDKLKPLIQEQIYEAFKEGFKNGHLLVTDYKEEQIQKSFNRYFINADILEVKHLTISNEIR